jgi:hypothetical protein
MEKRILIYFLALIFIAGYASAQEKILNGNFENADISMWAITANSPGVATLERSAVSPISGTNSLHVTITTPGATKYDLQLVQTFGVLKNKKYVITFKARASAAVTITTYMQQNHDPYGTITSKDNSLTTTAQAFKDSVNNYDIGTDPDAKLTIWLGLVPAGTELWFDDVSVMESNAPVQEVGLKAPGTEIIVNGKFESGTTPWVTELGGTGAATYTLDTASAIQGVQSAHIKVTNAGVNDYDVQFKQPLQVKKGKRYFIMYKARASKDMVIKAGIQEFHGSYTFLTPFKAESLHVATRTVLDTSGYLAADDANVKFTLFLGNNGTFDVWVDWVSIIENTMADPLNIKIDAERDAWYNGLTNPNDGKIYLPARAVMSDIGDAAINKTLTNDNTSAIVWTAWDRDYLYYYAEVHDDIVLDNNAVNWSNDKIELKYNPDPTVISTSNSLQVGISALGVDDAQVAGAVDDLSFDKNLYYPNGTVWTSTTDDFARQTISNGYILEWRIPLIVVNNSTAAQKLSPGVGGKFGEVINVADNDSTARSHMLSWSSGMKDVSWSNSQLHGTVTFLADNKLKYDAISPQVPDVYHNDSASVWYFGGLGPVSGVRSTTNVLPGTFALMQNYPNPFNPSTTIEFSVPVRSDVRIVLVNILGQVVKEVVSGDYTAGTYKVRLDASHLASGVYFYKLQAHQKDGGQAGNFVDIKKMVLMK